MRIAIISDIYANHEAYTAAWQVFTGRNFVSCVSSPDNAC